MGSSVIGKFRGLGDDSTIEATSLLKIDGALGIAEGAEWIVVVIVGISFADDDSIIDEEEEFSSFLSILMASANSISLQGACISYGFSSPRISPNNIEYWKLHNL